MTGLDVFTLVMRWTHISAAIVAGGGAFFIWYALLPAQQTLTDEQRQELHARLRARWSKVVMIAIAALLVSGLINIGYIEAKTTAPKVYSWYRPVFASKFLLAMGVFMLGSMLVGRSSAAQKLRRDMGTWLGVYLGLVLGIVMLSGVLSKALKEPKPSAQPPSIDVELGPEK